MDPVTIKFIQLIVAQVLGIVILIVGLWMFSKGVSGKSGTVLLKGAGFKAKLVNTSPSVVVMIVGLIVLGLGLTGHVERKTISHISNQDVLDEWLKNSMNINSGDEFIDVVNKIVGNDPNTRFKSYTKMLASNTTLEQLSINEYKNNKYWKLLAAVNKDRGYYSFKNTSKSTLLKKGSYYEVWHVSKYYGLREETLINVTGKAIKASYKHLLKLAHSEKKFDSNVFDSLTDYYKQNELSLLLSAADINGLDTFGELAIKYYGSKDYVELLVWVNKDEVPMKINSNTKLKDNYELLVLVLIR